MKSSRIFFVCATALALVFAAHASADISFNSDYRHVLASATLTGDSAAPDEVSSTVPGDPFVVVPPRSQSQISGPFENTATADQNSFWTLSPGTESFFASGNVSITANLGDGSLLSAGDALTEFDTTFDLTGSSNLVYFIQFGLNPTAPLASGQSIEGHFKLIDVTGSPVTLLSLDFINSDTQFDPVEVLGDGSTTIPLLSGHTYNLSCTLEASNTDDAAALPSPDFGASMLVSVSFQPVPEPATLAMFAAGMMLIVRKRRSRA